MFMSQLFESAITQCFQLLQVKRQQDRLFLFVLKDLRLGTCLAETVQFLSQLRCGLDNEI